MSKHEAVFEVDSKGDAHAVERLTERIYDTVREETRSVRTESADSDELLEAFETVRDAAANSETGRLTVVYEDDVTESK